MIKNNTIKLHNYLGKSKITQQKPVQEETRE